MKYSQFAVIALAACATAVEARKKRRQRVQNPAQQNPPQVQSPPQQNSTSTEKAAVVGTALGTFVNAANGAPPPTTDPALQNRQAIEEFLEARRRSIDDDDILALRYLIDNLNARNHRDTPHNPAPPGTTTSNSGTENKVTRGFDDNSVLEARRGGGGHGGGLGGGLGEFHSIRRRQAIEHVLRSRSVYDDERLVLRYLIEKIQAREEEKRKRRRRHSQHRTDPPKTTEGLNTTSTNATEPGTHKRSFEEQIDLRSFDDVVLNDLD